MSTTRVSRDAGPRDSSKLPRGPGGRALCRRCGVEVPVGRRAWCGPACIHDHQIESNPEYARNEVRDRDKEICALCRLDVGAWLRAYRAELRILSADSYDWPAIRDLDGRLTLVLGRRHGWEMDHIVPVVEGGGSCGLDNLRTLCIRCHRQETRLLAGRRARARKKQLALKGIA